MGLHLITVFEFMKSEKIISPNRNFTRCFCNKYYLNYYKKDIYAKFEGKQTQNATSFVHLLMYRVSKMSDHLNN